MQQPKKAFSNHPLNSKDKISRRDILASSLDEKRTLRGKSDSYHSFAPETTYIIKRNYLSSILTIVCSAILLIIVLWNSKAIDVGVKFLFILSISTLTLIYGIYELRKNIIADIKPKDDVKIRLSAKGIYLEGVSYNWDTLVNEKVLAEGVKPVNYFLYFESSQSDTPLKYPLSDFAIDLRELEYLMSVYRKRSDERIISKSDKYEQKYINLSKEKRSRYIMR